MRKYLAFVSVAMAACLFALVSSDPLLVEDDAMSEAGVVPTNEEETAQLEGKDLAFSDFCITQRDFIVKDVKARSNGKMASVFSTIFKSAEQLGSEAIAVQSDAVSRLSEQMRNPDAPIFEGETENDKLIADAQRAIQDSIKPQSYFQAFKSTIAATGNTVAGQVVARLEQLKGVFGLNLLVGALKDACSLVEEYDALLQSRFDRVVKDLAARDTSYMRLVKAPVGSIPCITTRRIVRLDGICKFFIRSSQFAPKLLGRSFS